MKQNTFSVHFVIRNNRVDKKGLVPIYSRIIINGDLIQFSLSQKIISDEWDNAEEKAKETCKTGADINQALEAIKSRIYQAYSKIMATSQELTTENFKSAYYGEREVIKLNTLIEAVKEHNENFKSMIDIKYSQGSYKNYKTTLKYLIEFVPTFNKKRDIPLKDVNYKFCEAFFTFLTTEKDCKVNGANKQMQRLKKIVNEGVKKGFIPSNPMANYKLEFTPVNKMALSLSEVEKLKKLKIKREVLLNVRDVFLFQCYTGLAYSDVKSLSIGDIFKEQNSVYWIKMSRQKTKISFSVPLLAPALVILKKHGLDKPPDVPLLPVLSNQKMNDNLKIIQELAGLDKNLTTHLARHTFATTITLSNGIPIETVSRMLGHTKLSTTQVYAKVHDSKIGKDMQGLMDKMNGKGRKSAE